MIKYSVLTYNFGKYEQLYEIPQNAIDSEIEYVYVTDDDSLKSDTWKIVYVDYLKGDAFDKSLQIRYNPFKYVSTDIVLKIDGSVGIINNVKPLFEIFEKYGYDAAVMPHFLRNTITDEYDVWVGGRDYPREQANKCIDFIKRLGYDLNYKGLYETSISIQKRDSFNITCNQLTYAFSKILATSPNTIERIDQILYSVVLNHFYSDKNILPLSHDIFCHKESNKYFKHYAHGKKDEYIYYPFIETQYLFNKPIIFR